MKFCTESPQNQYCEVSDDYREETFPNFGKATLTGSWKKFELSRVWAFESQSWVLEILNGKNENVMTRTGDW